MNIKRSGRWGSVHRTYEGGRDSICGLLWRTNKEVEETTEEVTCKLCLKIIQRGERKE